MLLQTCLLVKKMKIARHITDFGTRVWCLPFMGHSVNIRKYVSIEIKIICLMVKYSLLEAGNKEF